MNAFKERVQQFIEQYELFEKPNHILVALSGGPDSVALLRVLLELGYTTAAVHCNFYLRGAESNRDEQFVRNVCAKYGVELFVTSFDTIGYAQKQKVSIEMAARELRYGYFEQLKQDKGFDVVAVAHHRDDNVETLLLNLIRGTGIKGLTGIRPKNRFYVRPLLDVSRADVMAYLESLGQDYVIDRTNAEDTFTRNKIRLKLLPLMRTINPSVDITLQCMAGRMAETEKWCNKTLEDAKERVKESLADDEDVLERFSVTAIMREPSPELLLFYLLHPYGFTSAQIDDICKGMEWNTGKVFCSDSEELLIDRGCILIKKRNTREEAVYPLDAETTLLLGNKRLEVHELSIAELNEIPKERYKVALDADQLGENPYIRLTRKGDRFRPFGMKGSKLVSDYLTDCKRSLFQKRNQYVVCTASNEIAWLVGERIAAPYAIQTGKTRRVWLLVWRDAQ